MGADGCIKLDDIIKRYAKLKYAAVTRSELAECVGDSDYLTLVSKTHCRRKGGRFNAWYAAPSALCGHMPLFSVTAIA